MNSKNHIQKWFAPERPRSNEAALSLRSRRSGTKFAVSLLAKLLIKCRRLPRVCLGIFSIKCCFLGSSAENKHTSNKNIFMIDFYFLRLNYSFLNSQQTSIDKKGFPKEAPWKTLVLNEQLC